MKELDEKRKGLLLRMSYHRACVAAKVIMQPLIRRGYVSLNSCKNYELTPAGKKAAAAVMREFNGKHIETYGGISIGSEVMIVSTK